MLTAIVPVSGMAGRLGHLKNWLPTILNLDIKVIVVHDYKDGETENQLLAILEAINSSKIILLSGTYGSPGAARNAGLARVDTQYVCFWDSDDLPHPKAVMPELKIHLGKFDILIGQYLWSFFNSKDIEQKTVDDSSLRDVGINPGLWRMVFRTEFIKPVNFKNMRMGEDQVFLAEVVALTPRLSFSRTVFYEYFVGHPGQLTQSPLALSELLDAFTEIVALRTKTSNLEFEFLSILISRMRFTIAKLAVRKNAVKSMLIPLMLPHTIITRHPLLQIKSALFVIWRLVRSFKHDKFLVITGGLGNQLFQITGALSSTNQRIHVITCLGNPTKHEGELEVSKLDFQGRVQFKKCEKRHFLSPLAFRAMLSLATTRRKFQSESLFRITFLMLSTTIISAHLRRFVYPRISRGVGYDPKFRESKGNLFIGYFQTFRIPISVREILINSFNKVEKNLLSPKVDSSQLLIHVRLGDYRNEPTFGMLSSQYFSNAVNAVEKESAINGISLFSDEPNNALKVFPSHYLNRIKMQELRGESPLITLCRMRGYTNYIISNSTFSWWAAYTSEANNIFVPDPWFVNGENPIDLIPENWNRVARD